MFIKAIEDLDGVEFVDRPCSKDDDPKTVIVLSK